MPYNADDLNSFEGHRGLLDLNLTRKQPAVSRPFACTAIYGLSLSGKQNIRTILTHEQLFVHTRRSRL